MCEAKLFHKNVTLFSNFSKKLNIHTKIYGRNCFVCTSATSPHLTSDCNEAKSETNRMSEENSWLKLNN